MNPFKIRAGIYLIIGNQLEILADRLAELVRLSYPNGNANPLQPEWIIVQSKGMQRWLSMALASHNGICANMAFPFPNSFLETLYSQVVGPLPNTRPFDPACLTLRILKLLPELVNTAEFEPLQRYLASNSHPLKNYQLSRKIAEIFDQYLVFRPDMISQWQSGQGRRVMKTHAWQALLWQRLTTDIPTPHPAQMQQELVSRLSNPALAVSGLPPRASVFGISHLPTFHLQAFQALAKRIPVYLFLFNPCRHYWQDIISDRQMVRIRASKKNSAISREALHMERGNRLLASWGQLGKQFFNIIQEFDAQTTECFQDNSTQTLLGHLQQGIIDLVDDGSESRRIRAPKADGTLRLHSCHGPMREVEVLYDQLLDIFNHEPDIQPRDVIVMAPDIAEYAPYVHAVFGIDHLGEAQIPFSLADQNKPGESPIIAGFLQLLDMQGRRFEVSQAMALLEHTSIHRRFGLSASDLPLVETWIRNTNIRWGWDADERKSLGLPAYGENTWRVGLDSLLLGYALAGDQHSLFAGILPYDGVEGSDGTVLGGLVAFAEALHQNVHLFSSPATPSRWCEVLGNLLDRFFLSDEESAHDLQSLRQELRYLDRASQTAGSDVELPFEVIRQYLVDTLKHMPSGSGFLSGGVTFCAMLPMRSIPAKVICLLGMQHDAFPREAREPEFNLIAAHPQPMDRSKRNDDKYMFLEALLSARRIFYLSYVGQSIQDNSSIPPSAVISELLEYIAENFDITSDHLMIRHPLQSFSPVYFDGSQPHLFSYSKENQEASRLLSIPGRVEPFFPKALQAPSDNWRQCQLNQLTSFFANPTRYLLEERLGLHFHKTADPINDRERFNLDTLERYQIEQRLFAAWQKKKTDKETYNALRVAGDLPHGAVGKVLHAQLATDARQFGQRLSAFLAQEPVRSEHIDLTIARYRLHGLVDGLLPNCHIAYRLARLRPNDLLALFIHHLALCASPAIEQPMISRIVCKDIIWEFDPVDKPAEILNTYLDLYWEGLCRPVHFFAQSSYAYAHHIVINGKPSQAAKIVAWKKWKGSDFAPGESRDLYLARCFNNQDPLDHEFEELALAVFNPLLTAGRQKPIVN